MNVSCSFSFPGFDEFNCFENFDIHERDDQRLLFGNPKNYKIKILDEVNGNDYPAHRFYPDQFELG